MTTFDGIWVPLVTPFRQQKIDLRAAQQLALQMTDAGVKGLVVCGTTGEAATLDDTEQARLLAAIQEAVPANCPVALGLSGSGTYAMVERLKRFGTAPAAYLISAPAYVRPSQEGIRLHFEALAAASGRPIILYNIPSRTGVNIDVETVAALAANPKFVAIKDCGGQLDQTSALLSQSGLNVLCGDDALMFDVFAMGAQGAISASAHIRPDLFVHLLHLIKHSKTREALALFSQLLPLIKVLFSEPNPAPVKAALSMLWGMEDSVRLPMTPMSNKGKLQLAKVLEQVMAIPGPSVLNFNSPKISPSELQLQLITETTFCPKCSAELASEHCAEIMH